MTFFRLPLLILLFAVSIVCMVPPALTRAEDKFVVCGDCEGAAYGEGISSHPRLFYTPQRLEGLKKRIPADSRIKEAWEDLLVRADKLVLSTGRTILSGV